jgi:hypothetical protein
MHRSAMVPGSFRKRAPASPPVHASPMAPGSFRHSARARVRPCLTARWCWVRFVRRAPGWVRFVRGITSHLPGARARSAGPGGAATRGRTLHRSTIGPSGRAVPRTGGVQKGPRDRPRPTARVSTKQEPLKGHSCPRLSCACHHGRRLAEEGIPGDHTLAIPERLITSRCYVKTDGARTPPAANGPGASREPSATRHRSSVSRAARS